MRVDDAKAFEDNAAACIKALHPQYDWYVHLKDYGRLALLAVKVPNWSDKRVKGRLIGGPPEAFMEMAEKLCEEIENAKA